MDYGASSFGLDDMSSLSKSFKAKAVANDFSSILVAQTA